MSMVIIRRDGSAKLLEDHPGTSLTVDGESFVTDKPDPDWLGFYDWLRVATGEVIGVRLQLDDPSSIASEVLELLCSVDSRNSRDELYVFFGSQREFEPALSDDADFGGNVLYRGEFGSVALTFNSPTARLE